MFVSDLSNVYAIILVDYQSYIDECDIFSLLPKYCHPKVLLSGIHAFDIMKDFTNWIPAKSLLE